MTIQGKPVIKKIKSQYTADLIDKLKNIESSALLTSSCVVFKVCDAIIESLKNDEKSRAQIYERSAERPVYLIVYDAIKNRHDIYNVGIISLVLLNDCELLDSIRSSDLLEIIYKSKGDCIIDAPAGVHFVTPSNIHTTKFIRVADALHSYNALDRMSFWLQSKMNGVSGVLIDSWSLSSVLLRTQSLLEITDMPFDSFSQHVAHDEVSAISTLTKLDSQIHNNGKILIIISITSSGSFIERLKTLMAHANIEREVEILSLYKFKESSPDIESLSILDFDIKCFEEDECVYCGSEERKTKYDIHPKFYYPRENTEKKELFKASYLNEIYTKKFWFLKFKRKCVSSGVDFIQKYGLVTDALCVHRDDPNDGVNPRHHAFYIDVCALLEDVKFVNELQMRIDDVYKKCNIDIIVIPKHSAGCRIRDVIQKYSTAQIIMSDDLKNLTLEEIELISTSSHICIIDDVVITGGRFDRYVRTLRGDLHESTTSIKHVTWFPLIARPENHSTIATLKKSKLTMHSWRDELIYMYEVIMPNWQMESCPWCHELDILSRNVEVTFDSDSCVEERINILFYNRDKGITNNTLFLFENVERKELAGNSPLARPGATDIMLLFVLSIGLQKFRNKSTLPLGRYIYQSTVLDGKGNFERFSEPLLQAIFLRVVKINEWDKDILNSGIDFINNQVKKGENDNVLGELIIFLHRIGSVKSLPKEIIDKSISLDDKYKSVYSLLERFGI